MKNTTVIDHIDEYGDEKQLLMATSHFETLLKKEWPFGSMPFCSQSERCAIADELDKFYSAKSRRGHEPQPLWGAY